MPEPCVICEKVHDDIAVRDVTVPEPRAICGPCYTDFKLKNKHYPNVKEILSKKSKENKGD